MTYDAEQKLLTTTDAMSNVTTDAYDHLGRLTSVTQPNPSTGASTGGPVTSFGYDSMNRVTSRTNALSYATLYVYDQRGRIDLDKSSHTHRRLRIGPDDELPIRWRWPIDGHDRPAQPHCQPIL